MMTRLTGPVVAAASRLLPSVHPTKPRENRGGRTGRVIPFHSHPAPRFSGKGGKARLKARLLIATALLLVPACSSAPERDDRKVETPNGSAVAALVPLPDGRSVTCVIMDGYESGGISCDWDRVR